MKTGGVVLFGGVRSVRSRRGKCDKNISFFSRPLRKDLF